MAILVCYQIPPEDAVVEILRTLLQECGFQDRKMDIPVIAGHPLFSEGISEEGADREFPKIGVEWTTDERTDFIGQGYTKFKPSADFKTQLQGYKTYLQDNRRMSPESVIDALTESKLVERFHHLVDSNVIIAGFASGGSGRKQSRWMYEAVDACIAPLLMDLQALYPGVSLKTTNHHEINLVTDDYGTRLWGFEIPIIISQYRTTLRTVPNYADIAGFDIHLVNSRTRFMGSFGLETYGQGHYTGHFAG